VSEAVDGSVGQAPQHGHARDEDAHPDALAARG